MIYCYAYKTIDGKFFEKKQDAERHERIGILMGRISEFKEAFSLTSDAQDAIIAWENFKSKDRLLASVESMAITVRTVNCLKTENINTIEELVRQSSASLLKTPNLGRKCLNEIIEALSSMGLQLSGESE
jgi:DNA-directed RNA polymerase subunit alpha